MPLTHREGKTYFCFNGKCYALFPFIESFQFRKMKLTKKAYKEAGEMLARIHQATKDRKPKINLPRRNFAWDKRETLKKLEMIRKLIINKPAKTSIDALALKLIALKKKLVSENKVASEKFQPGKIHVIHGDYHESNLFFSKSSEVEYVFDWECVKYAPRTMEITRALSLMCFHGYFKEKNYANALTFLRAYSCLYPLKKEEFSEALRVGYLIHVHSLWVLEEYYVKGKRKVYRFLGDQMRFLVYISRNLEIYIGKLTGEMSS